METELINKKWAEFEGLTINPLASKRQRDDMKRSFFAGGLIVLCEMVAQADKASEEETLDRFVDIEKELSTFLEEQARA